MILVTLGTQDWDFTRLLSEIQRQIELNNINERIIVQAGYTKFKSDDMEILDLIPSDKFNQLIKDCDLLITHGGVGSILTGLKNDKKIIAVARLSEYREAANNHQLQIIDNFSKKGYIIDGSDLENFGTSLKSIKEFIPKKFVSNNEEFISFISKYIDRKN